MSTGLWIGPNNLLDTNFLLLFFGCEKNSWVNMRTHLIWITVALRARSKHPESVAFFCSRFKRHLKTSKENPQWILRHFALYTTFFSMSITSHRIGSCCVIQIICGRPSGIAICILPHTIHFFCFLLLLFFSYSSWNAIAHAFPSWSYVSHFKSNNKWKWNMCTCTWMGKRAFHLRLSPQFIALTT